MRAMCLSMAGVRSVYFIPSEPRSIFSKPTARAQSTRPPLTAWRARNSALAVGGVAVAVAGVGLLHALVGDAGVGERARSRLEHPVGVVAVLGARLVELRHAYPDHEGANAHQPISFGACAGGMACELIP